MQQLKKEITELLSKHNVSKTSSTSKKIIKMIDDLEYGIARESGSAKRSRGHNAERALATLFKEIGFPNCATTRATSKLLDDTGIDLNFLPFIIQSKAGVTQIDPSREIEYIQDRLEDLPEEEAEWKNKPIIVVNIKKAARPKRTELDDIASMTLKDLLTIIQKAYLTNNYDNTSHEGRNTEVLRGFRNESELTKKTD
jgi:hypothetical protein